MCGLWIKGVGAVTPHGFGVQPLSSAQGTPSATGALVPIDPHDRRFKPLRKWSASAQYAYMAVEEALAGRKFASPHRAGCVVGTNYSNLEAIVALDADARQFGAGNTNPGIFPETVLNSIGGHLAEAFQLSGVNVTISDGDRTGWNVLRYAVDLLRQQQADEAIVCVIDRFPPARFRGVLPCGFPQESVSVLWLSGESESGAGAGVRMRLEHGAPAEKGGVGPDRADLWNLPLAIAQAAARLRGKAQAAETLSFRLADRGRLTVRLGEGGRGA